MSLALKGNRYEDGNNIDWKNFGFTGRAAIRKKGQMMDPMLRAGNVIVGFHPDGYRIDKTTLPMNKYTKWDVLQGNLWCNPKPVCFDSLPKKGWIAKDKFDWDKPNNTTMEYD